MMQVKFDERRKNRKQPGKSGSKCAVWQKKQNALLFTAIQLYLSSETYILNQKQLPMKQILSF